MKRGTRRGCFQLKHAIIGIDDEDDSTFTIRVENRIYHFQGKWSLHCWLAIAFVTLVAEHFTWSNGICHVLRGFWVPRES